eukprot:13682368-Ditylum_brightwellii.AAC.1
MSQDCTQDYAQTTETIKLHGPTVNVSSSLIHHTSTKSKTGQEWEVDNLLLGDSGTSAKSGDLFVSKWYFIAGKTFTKPHTAGPPNVGNPSLFNSTIKFIKKARRKTNDIARSQAMISFLTETRRLGMMLRGDPVCTHDDMVILFILDSGPEQQQNMWHALYYQYDISDKWLNKTTTNSMSASDIAGYLSTKDDKKLGCFGQHLLMAKGNNRR